MKYSRFFFLILHLCFFITARSQWKPANDGLPAETKASCLAVKGTSLFAALNRGGFFSSDNNGTNWNRVDDGKLWYRLNSILFTETTVFAGTYGGLSQSADGGKTWAKNKSAAFENKVIYSLARKEKNILAGCNGGYIVLSKDNGKSWKEIPNKIYSGTVYSLLVNGNNIYAGTHQNGVLLSTDNGVSWKYVNNGLPISRSIRVYSLISRNNVLFAATNNGVYTSANGGELWTAVTAGLTQEVDWLAENGTSVFAGTKQGVFLLGANGQSWTAVNNGLGDNTIIISMAVIGTTVFVSTENGGLYASSNNGALWQACNNGLPLENFVSALTVQGDKIFAGTEGGRMLLSTNNGASWKNYNKGLPEKKGIQSLAATSENIYASVDQEQVYRLDDDTWSVVNTGLNCRSVYSLATAGSTVYAAGTGGLYSSVDKGKFWAKPKGYGQSGFFWAIKANGSTVFAAPFTSGSTAGIFLSTDKGNSWSETKNGFKDSVCIKTFAFKGDTAFAGTNKGVFISYNNGALWAEAIKGLNNAEINCFTTTGSIVVAGTSKGIFISRNNGKTWEETNTGLPPGTSINSLAVNGSTIFAGTNGYGVWINDTLIKSK